MLTLNLPTEPYWVGLRRDVRLEIRPVTTAVMAAAYNATATTMMTIALKNQQAATEYA